MGFVHILFVNKQTKLTFLEYRWLKLMEFRLKLMQYTFTWDILQFSLIFLCRYLNNEQHRMFPLTVRTFFVGFRLLLKFTEWTFWNALKVILINLLSDFFLSNYINYELSKLHDVYSLIFDMLNHFSHIDFVESIPFLHKNCFMYAKMTFISINLIFAFWIQFRSDFQFD